MPVFAGGPDPRNRPRRPRPRLRLRLPFRPRPAAATAGPTRSASLAASRTVFAFLGLLALLFVVAFAVGRQAGPVAPDLRKPGPPGAPVKMGDEGGGGHGSMGLGEPAGAPRAASRTVGGVL
ncbi:hypothetical protein [Embleya sp. AB8]|uniref:hypothetical protein n=1 Tax=Embleya sp. AB8 TaxID=3156304 RepID=UPI003C70AF6D